MLRGLKNSDVEGGDLDVDLMERRANHDNWLADAIPTS
jgi:hypothetical protein